MATAQATTQPPPDMSGTEQAVLAALTLVALAPEVPDVEEVVEKLLAPLGILGSAARLAATLGFGAVMLTPRTTAGPASGVMTRTAPARRAAFVLASAKRADQALRDAPRMRAAADALAETGSPEDAVKLREQADTRAHPEVGERRFLAQHLAAERARLVAAARVDEVASAYGPVLGWLSRRDDLVTPECREADGKLFRADRPPAIGLPGTLHGGACRCVPVPPFPGGTMLA